VAIGVADGLTPGAEGRDNGDPTEDVLDEQQVERILLPRQ
jgi:hypothetical protein